MAENSNNVKSFLAKTIPTIESGSFTWNIENFSNCPLQQGHELKSEANDIANCDWSFILRKSEPPLAASISVEVELENYGGYVVQTVASVVKSDGESHCVFREYSMKEGSVEFKFNIPEDMLNSCKDTYLPNDTLTLRFDVKASMDCKTEVIELPISDENLDFLDVLSLNISALYVSGRCSDVVIRVGNEEINAHKAILAARSPIFSGLFANDSDQNLNDVVRIDDFEIPVVKEMLRYMYGGGLADAASGLLAKLYSAADKYLVVDLKRLCAQLLGSGLTVANVCEVAVLADTYEDLELLEFAKDFVSSHISKILTSDEWGNIVEERPRLATKLKGETEKMD